MALSLRRWITAGLPSWFLCAFLIAPMAVAHAEFVVPPLTGPVVDNANMLSPQAKERLSRFLRQLYESGGSQLQVVTLPDLGGVSIEEAGIKLADAWKIGAGGTKDNGVILIFAAAERRVRIEVGQGLEGDLPDVIAQRIIREVIVPRMREGGAEAAIFGGVSAILHYTDPNYGTAGGEAAAGKPRKGKLNGNAVQLVLMLIFFTFLVLPALFGRRRRGLLSAGRRGIYTGGFGGGGFGGGGFGGGGGGWSGGGGGFSGGGSSGSW